MPTQEEKLREGIEDEIGEVLQTYLVAQLKARSEGITYDFDAEKPVVNWFLARTIPKETVEAAVESFRVKECQRFGSKEVCMPLNQKDAAINTTLSDLSTRLGVSKK